jgi:glycosyltransferase involved in cell wall biosynthesis
MRSVLYVIPDLAPGGAARQLTLLAAGLPRDRFRAHVCVLGGEALWAADLRGAGVEVEALEWHRPFDLFPFFSLRRRLKTLRPDVIHAWGATSLKALAFVGARGSAHLIASAALPPGRRTGWPERWLLRRAHLVTAFGAGEVERLRRHGVPPARVVEVPPAVRPAPDVGAGGEPGAGPTPTAPPLPERGRVLLVVGPLLPHKGCVDAVWALDVLHYLYEDLHLVFVGDGPERASTAAFARSVESTARVHFTGPVADVRPWLRRAEVVWVPGRAGGICATLEAMAAGRPVVAARVPGPADLVAEGVNGYLVDAGDKTALARQTRFLLDDPAQRRSFGAEGQRRATTYTVEQMVAAFVGLYQRGGEGLRDK